MARKDAESNWGRSCWVCTECSNKNPQSFNECVNCGQGRPCPFGDGELIRDANIIQEVKDVKNSLKENAEQVNSVSRQNELRIIVIGKTGAGKSASCNTLVGKKCFTSKISFGHVTKESFYAKAERCLDEEKFILHIVDTPGTLGDGENEKELSNQLARASLITAPGPHCFLLISSMLTRADGEKTMMKIYEDVFGKDFYRNVIMVFTGKENSSQSNTVLEDMFKETTGFPVTLLEKNSHRYVWFNNNAMGEENDNQVRELLKIIEKLRKEKDFYRNEIFSRAQAVVDWRVSLGRKNEPDKSHNEHLQNARDEASGERKTHDGSWMQILFMFFQWVSSLLRKSQTLK